MPQVSRVLWEFNGRYSFWCPGCNHAHTVAVRPAASPSWEFDGNLDKPTFKPSFREYTPANESRGRPEKTNCHLFVVAGRIQYLGVCDHALAGATVDMQDLPQDYGWPGSH